MKLKEIYIICNLFFFQYCVSQNLVPNPSFEGIRPKNIKKVGQTDNFNCLEWEAPSKVTPDYYVSGKKGKFTDKIIDTVPKYKESHSGNRHVGILGYGKSTSALHQYLQVKLKEKLIKNQSYCFSLYVSPRSMTKLTTNEIDYCLTEKKLDFNTSGRISLMEYQKCIINKKFFKESCWNFVSSCYTATGSENYLIIGFINPDFKIISSVKQDSPSNSGVYLFIDDVSLTPVADPNECKCNDVQVTKCDEDLILTLNKTFVMKNVNFENGKDILLPSSHTELDKLVAYLKSNANFKIEIMGHTDNVGSENENQKLSEARAKAVSEYLIKSGIEKKRVNYKGFGSQKPLKSNNSEENKVLNRRVEVKLI